MKLYIDENNKVVTMHEATSDMKCFEEFENRKPYSFDGVKELENCIHPIHVLLNTSMIDEKWIYMNLNCKRQVICWIENHIKKIDNYIEN